MAGGIAAQNGKMSWNFDKDKVGEIAKGFTNEVGKWEVVADEHRPVKTQCVGSVGEEFGADVQYDSC